MGAQSCTHTSCTKVSCPRSPPQNLQRTLRLTAPAKRPSVRRSRLGGREKFPDPLKFYRTFDKAEGMTQTTSEQINTHPTLSRAAQWSPEDATLSGNERALANIVAALAADFDALDAAEQRALVDILETQTRATEQAEETARKILDR